MAKLNLDFYCGQDAYSDGDIEEKMLRMAKENIGIEDIDVNDLEFPIIYHFSHVRENILNWYPFEENSTVLEVGSGCGAITGLLCQRIKHVVSIELSKRRALINFERNKDYDNLEIIVGNINQININLKFDYIVLNGVFEYAKSFTEGDNPYVTFLNMLSNKLSEKGKILIAIENRLGLKYFAGASEDHTGNFFLGLNGYKSNKNVQTFTKKEIKNIMMECGLVYHNFYYPYPDYKFPNEIFTEESLLNNNYGRPTYSLSSDRLVLFNQTIVSSTLAKEGVLDYFTNSFLIEASKDKISDNNITYVKINNDRKIAYRITTLIYNKKTKSYAVKRPLNKLANEHIKNLYKNTKSFKGNNYKALIGEYENNGFKYPLIKSESLDVLIRDFISSGNVDKITDILKLLDKTFFDNSVDLTDFYNTEFIDVFGSEKIDKKLPCVKPANVDLICDNIFLESNTFTVIDCEWIFDFYIPKQFIMWRTINELYTKHPDLEVLIGNSSMMKLFQIDETLEQVFRKWAIHFAEEYVMSNSLEKKAKKDYFISLDNIYNKILQDNVLCSKIYYDLGKGFNEECIIVSNVELNNKGFVIEYLFEKIENIIRLRWDPIELKACKCTIKSIESNISVTLNPINAENFKDNTATFVTNDPMYSVDGDVDQLKYLKIIGEIIFLDNTELINEFNLKCNTLSELNLKEQSLINDKNIQAITNLQDELNVQRQCIAELKQELEISNNLIDKEKELISSNIDYIAKLQDELQSIHNSKAWGLIKKYRNTKEKLNHFIH